MKQIRYSTLQNGQRLAGNVWVWLIIVLINLPMNLLHAQVATLEPAVIPNPASIQTQPGSFRISNATLIIVPPDDKEAKHAADYLSDLVQRTHGLRLNVEAGAERINAINLHRTKDKPLANEAYQLVVAPQNILISASSASGLLYGGISLWQLVPAGKGEIEVPSVSINDAPRFPWRGIMLDSARHYQSPEFIRHFIDWMALHKLNVLHWHLTDDQAWRLEIIKYPKLAAIGGWRIPAGAAAQADIDPATGKPRQYGGIYTQQNVREIVDYAKARGINIVPEIEIPGHATATLVAYPQLGASNDPPKVVPADWGIYPNVYNVEDSTFTFLEDVLKEVMTLFPSKYIHVGGDEVEKTQWKQSPAVQERMRKLGISDPAALQVYFTQRIGKFLQKNGRRLVGWDEILEPGLPASSVVMSWRGIDGALKAASKGFDTILSPSPTLYFDNRQSDAADEMPGRGNLISLEEVYRFEPMPEKLTAEQQRHILGLQANVWTEHIRTEERTAAMTFPRAAAIAELGWSAPEKRNWPDFVKRLSVMVGRYNALKIPYADSAFAVRVTTNYIEKQVRVDLSTQTKFGSIRYTLNGQDPTPQSPLYFKPILLPFPAELRAAAFLDNDRLSRPRVIPLRPELAQRRASQELQLCSADIKLSFEDDAPLKGPRAVFLMDIGKPCWIFPQADMSSVTNIGAAVGQVPFNFQIGDGVHKIHFPKPTTPEGELQVHLDKCDGEIIARLPLAPAASSSGVTVLPAATIKPITGKHDLCMQFAQNFDYPSSYMWALDWINLTGR